jgi:ATP-dependent RNA helicase DeaD
LTVSNIEQFYLEVREATKLDILTRLIDANSIKLSLVFCNTKRRVDELTSHLQSRGYMAEALHGDMRQAQRDKVMAKFRKGVIDILIATDVAARGIDVDDIEAVFNYDLPNDEEYYVHRIGRTGRAGRTGKAFTFISGREIYKLRDIQRYTKSRILPQKPPSLVDVEDNKINNILDNLKNTLTQGHISKYVSAIENFLEDTDLKNDQEDDITTLDIAAALLKMAIQPNGAQIMTDLTTNGFESNGNNEKIMVRLFINAGRDIKLQPKQLIQSIVSLTNLSEKQIGDINIYDKFTFIEVPAKFATEVLSSLKNTKINNRKINVEKANEK